MQEITTYKIKMTVRDSQHKGPYAAIKQFRCSKFRGGGCIEFGRIFVQFYNSKTLIWLD